MAEFHQCQSCGESVNIGNDELPVRYVTRQANNRDPQSFFIIGGRNGIDRLVHRCVIEDET